MVLPVPHISLILVLITFGFIFSDGGTTNFRASRAFQALGVLWAMWIAYLLTQYVLRHA